MCSTHLHIQMLHICVCMYVHFYSTYVAIMLKMETLIMAGIRSGRSFHMYAVHVHGSCAVASCTHTHSSSAPLCIRHTLFARICDTNMTDYKSHMPTPYFSTSLLLCNHPQNRNVWCARLHEHVCAYRCVWRCLGVRCNNQQHASVNHKHFWELH